MGNEDWREERGEAAGREDGEASRGPNKISAATKYSFTGKNLTAYGGLLPVAAMLEKLEFQQLVGEFGESESETDAESKGAQRISTRHDPGCLCWILPAEPLAVSGTRADAAGDIAGGASPCKARFEVERQLGRLNARLRERVWAAAPVRLTEVTLDTDTTVHTLYGGQMGGRVSYNRKNRGKPSDQPMLTFIAETREYAGGQLHNGDKPSGEDIALHLARVIETLPNTVETPRARAGAGYYCWEAVRAYTHLKCEFVIVGCAHRC